MKLSDFVKRALTTAHISCCRLLQIRPVLWRVGTSDHQGANKLSLALLSATSAALLSPTSASVTARALSARIAGSSSPQSHQRLPGKGLLEILQTARGRQGCSQTDAYSLAAPGRCRCVPPRPAEERQPPELHRDP